MKNEQPRLDDAVQRVVEAKYNKLQAKGLCAISRSVCGTDDDRRKATSIIGRPSTDT
jgi:hypothetical protein